MKKNILGRVLLVVTILTASVGICKGQTHFNIDLGHRTPNTTIRVSAGTGTPRYFSYHCADCRRHALYQGHTHKFHKGRCRRCGYTRRDIERIDRLYRSHHYRPAARRHDNGKHKGHRRH